MPISDFLKPPSGQIKYQKISMAGQVLDVPVLPKTVWNCLLYWQQTIPNSPE